MEDLKGKRLLILGGTRISCEIIEAAKKMGVYVIVTDYNSVAESPGKQIADEFYQVSATDVDGVVELIHEKKIDGVLVGFADVLLPFYADICKKSGLPCYADRQLFEIFIDKAKYKPLLKKYNIPTVEEYYIDRESMGTGSKHLSFPVLVKPADSSGARGITICYNEIELESAIQKAALYSKCDEVLVEKYLEGREVTVFWVFQDGKYYLTAIGNRHVKKNQSGVIPLPVGYTYPASILPAFKKNQEDCFIRMFQDIRIKDGMMFFQCKVENETCIVYDIGYRLTGSLEYKHIEKICGFNPMKMMIHFALTGNMGEDLLDQKVNPAHSQKAYNVSCIAKPGDIAEIEGCETVQEMSSVLDVCLAHLPGERIDDTMKGLLSQITVRVLGVVDEENQLYSEMHKIESAIRILTKDGDDLKLPGIEREDIEGLVL